jgi:2-amino-4-hydroxy-6-hydroxymethyldihydropteridine diphosphokinase
MAVAAYVGLGSNLGDSRAVLERALDALAALPGTRVTAASSLYATAPVGVTQQPEFLNRVAALETSLPPADLMARLLEIEAREGRVRSTRWGPRTIDLDILLYGDLAISGASLTVPHPEMTRRGFVLAPLAEIAPDALHPTSGRTARNLLADWRMSVSDPDALVRRLPQGAGLEDPMPEARDAEAVA